MKLEIENFSEYSELNEIGVVKNYEPKECFIHAGQIPKKLGIVKKGLFRYKYTSDEGREYTKAFMLENNFMCSYSSMITHSPSHFSIEAIEHSKVLEVDYNSWKKLISQDKKWDKLLITLLEKAFHIKEKRERENLLLDAESRYKIFLNEYSDLEKRLKQHMVASYIGITPIALSRIKKKVNFINIG